MIIDLPHTTSDAINRSLIEIREKGGAAALSRVLTLVIVTGPDAVDEPIAAANSASHEHPCRVIAVVGGSRRGAARMDAQIRVGGDAGASEVIVLQLSGPLAAHPDTVTRPLLLSDAPVLAWWPGRAPADPAADLVGALAQRRITDARNSPRPRQALAAKAASYRPGDTDLAWTRVTMWRGQLAAALQNPPHRKVLRATVTGAANSSGTDLLAGWLALRLRCPVRRHIEGELFSGVHSVTLHRQDGDIRIHRPGSVSATLALPNYPDQQIALPRRELRDCLSEELRQINADEVYREVLLRGLEKVTR